MHAYVKGRRMNTTPQLFEDPLRWAKPSSASIPPPWSGRPRPGPWKGALLTVVPWHAFSGRQGSLFWWPPRECVVASPHTSSPTPQPAVSPHVPTSLSPIPRVRCPPCPRRARALGIPQSRALRPSDTNPHHPLLHPPTPTPLTHPLSPSTHPTPQGTPPSPQQERRQQDGDACAHPGGSHHHGSGTQCPPSAAPEERGARPGRRPDPDGHWTVRLFCLCRVGVCASIEPHPTIPPHPTQTIAKEDDVCRLGQRD